MSPMFGAQRHPPEEIRDDLSDVSETHEMSLWYSAHVRNVHFQQKASEEVFSDHAVKIYKKENEWHWRRFGERLDKVGIENLLLTHARGRLEG